MKKISIILLSASLCLFVYGISLDKQEIIKEQEVKLKFPMTKTIDENPFVGILLDENVCSVCIINVYDYLSIIEEKYDNKVYLLVDKNINKKKLNRIEKMITKKIRIQKIDLTENNLAYRTLNFVDNKEILRGSKNISSNGITPIEIKKEIIAQGFNFIK